MAIPYIVCRKVDATKKEKPQLWYAVGKKMQKKSGRTERDVAHRVAQRTGFHPGVVEAVLAATGEIIEEELSDGRSVRCAASGRFRRQSRARGSNTRKMCCHIPSDSHACTLRRIVC